MSLHLVQPMACGLLGLIVVYAVREGLREVMRRWRRTGEWIDQSAPGPQDPAPSTDAAAVAARACAVPTAEETGTAASGGPAAGGGR
ncbi:hypothetical protein [Actinomadura violacea]|uniref:Uncharacterized protein n=1 Tax=Actinomadura violacea TaxID=2819934 RepID=A0ABS3S8B7_9ACTN|nr:hypothetical protein [Actinomadura violacea]MBO2464470.1 hypothetical protein [Actinomadura violacea]